MADRPILFTGPMVRALLAGTKTQTRRGIVMPKYRGHSSFGTSDMETCDWHFQDRELRWHDMRRDQLLELLQFHRGDRLWVRENWRCEAAFDDYAPVALPLGDIVAVQYEADGARHMWQYDHLPTGRLRPSLHMPRWASRLTLTVTDVRVERLQDITNEDCIAEGVPVHPNTRAPRTGPVNDAFAREHGLISHYGAEYKRIWEAINGSGSWEANPWVAVYTFTVQRGNIDQLARAA